MGVHDDIHDRASQNYAEAVLIPVFADSMRITPCPATAVVNFKHTFDKTCLICPQTV
jgi:hypothetical protein